ncbi:MAG: agmatine deiminase family protein [Bacteroidales bacterium]
MISDFETNTIYFSEKLKKDFPKTCNQIIEALKSKGIEPKFLPNTNDIWARDFMPIQVSENKFIEYRYDPDYLQAKKYRKLKSYPDIICESIGLKTVKTDLIIDGGNVIKSKDCVILTDKIVVENKDFYTKEKLIDKLKNLFEIEKIVLIPWDKKEQYGHADGMIRFIDENSVLIPKYFDEYDKEFNNKLFGELDKNGLSWKKMELNIQNENSWGYLNFLQTQNVILLPTFGIDEDDLVLKQMKNYFTDYSDGKIIKINMSEIIKHDGALNCISWTIKN